MIDVGIQGRLVRITVDGARVRRDVGLVSPDEDPAHAVQDLALVRRAAGIEWKFVGWGTGRLHPVFGEDVQTDAGALQNDRRLFEGACRL